MTKPQWQVVSEPVTKAERNPNLYGWMQRWRATATLTLPGGRYRVRATGLTREAAEHRAVEAAKALAAAKARRRVRTSR